MTLTSAITAAFATVFASEWNAEAILATWITVDDSGTFLGFYRGLACEGMRLGPNCIVRKEAEVYGIKTWDYCGRYYRYFCTCTPYDPSEIQKGEACPTCGAVHSEFRSAGL